MIIGNYNVTAEIICLIVAIFLFLLMLYSNPRKTRSYTIVFSGVILSIFTIISQIALISASTRTDIFGINTFFFLSSMFLFMYLIILCFIYASICLLSSNTRQHIHYLHYRMLAIALLYIIATVILFYYNSHISEHFPVDTILTFYTTAGLIDCVFSYISVIRNHKTIPSVTCKYAIIFIILDFIMLAVQIHFKYVIFTSLSYVLPFMILYILFHSNPYDEVIGCQNKYSYEARFSNSVLIKRNFLIIDIRFPQLKNVNYAIHNQQIDEMAALICREIELLHRLIHIYRIDPSEFAVMVYIRDENKVHTFINNVEQIINRNIQKASFNVNYRMVAFRNNPVISTTHRLNSLTDYLFSIDNASTGNCCYIATDTDYENFHETYRIEQMLLDIRNKNDLNDPRVICYAQPIFSVKDNSFRTAETLMRLQLDETIIYPDKFIPLAEKNGCIHTLTTIILNKVCSMIHELESLYSFDAITVNCSSSELSDKHLFDELMSIINANHVEARHIRLELTESSMFDDFDTVLYNMKKFNESGVMFYLDDFGTGYSNLERIIGCPFHTIKFDKSLLYKALKNDGVSDLMSHMISVFKKQGFILLIEGVEDDYQNEYCISQGFDYIQGYRYSKPHPIEELTDYFVKIQ